MKYAIAILIFFSAALSACPQLDKVKTFIKSRLYETWKDHPENYLESEQKDKLEVYFEIYEYIESIEKSPGLWN